ncbi:hypothetical protein Tco_1447571 [Tanacetum coccineum]
MVDSRVNEIAKKTVPLYVAEGLLLDKQKIQADVAVMIVEVVQKERENLQAEITLQVTNDIANSIPPYVGSFFRNYMSNNILHVRPTQVAVSSARDLQTVIVRTRDHEDHLNDDSRPEGESNAKRQKISEYGTYSVSGSSSEQAMDQEPNPSGLGTQEQLDKFNDWVDDLGTDDDEVPTEKVSPERMEEISREIDEAQLQKAINDMMRQRCNSGEEHQYHVDQMQNYLKSGVVWENRKERLSLPTLEKPTPNLWEKKDHIRRQKQLRDKPEEVYSESKIVEVIRTSYELGHEHKFITKIVVRRANGKIDPITEPDYKYLNKNDIEDLYLLCIYGRVKDYRETGLLGSLSVFIRSTIIWEKVHDFQLRIESYQQKVNLTALTITFPNIKRKKLCSITSKPVIGMIYDNNKKEKRVMILKEIPNPTDAKAGYLQFYKEYIEDRLKHRDQIRRWEMYMNGRPLDSRRGRRE